MFFSDYCGFNGKNYLVRWSKQCSNVFFFFLWDFWWERVAFSPTILAHASLWFLIDDILSWLFVCFVITYLSENLVASMGITLVRYFYIAWFSSLFNCFFKFLLDWLRCDLLWGALIGIGLFQTFFFMIDCWAAFQQFLCLIV